MYLLNDSSYADRILHTRKYIDICFPALHSFGSIKSQKTTINYTLGRFKMLFCLAKMTLKLSKSVETAIITDMGLDTPPLEKPPETNLQSCPTAGSRSVDKMDELCSARLFLGLFDGNAS